ncbi:transposable element Tcb1 transposase [Trichonephila clavipes]|nr:transposable element Tcb1 transposase [Trichonephila clavipes]
MITYDVEEDELEQHPDLVQKDDSKLAQRRPKNSSSVEYTTDEEDMIVFDAEEEIESNPDLILYLYCLNECLAQLSQNWLLRHKNLIFTHPRCWRQLSVLTFRAWPQPYYRIIRHDHTWHALSKGSSLITRLNCFSDRLALNVSPIENMWSMVAQRLTQITPPAATPDQLWQRVEAAWSVYPKNTSKVSLNQYLDVWQWVISNNGGY